MAPLVSEDLRAVIGEFYLSGTPLGSRLEELVPRVEELEKTPRLAAFLEHLHRTGALSVPPADLRAAVEDALETECGGRPCVAEDGQP